MNDSATYAVSIQSENCGRISSSNVFLVDMLSDNIHSLPSKGGKKALDICMTLNAPNTKSLCMSRLDWRKHRRTYYHTLQRTIPPTLLSIASRASSNPVFVKRNKHSPGRVSPSTKLDLFPLTILSRSSTSTLTLRLGLLTISILLITGSFLQYFRPTHTLC